MAFNTALGTMTDMLKRRHDEYQTGAARTWALPTGTGLKEQIAAFNTDEENAAWSEINASGKMPFSDARRLRPRISWLAGTLRDLRSQYATGEDAEPRTAISVRASADSGLIAALRSSDYLKKVQA